MIYPYHCPICGNDWDIVKPLSQMNRAETCTECNALLERVITAPNINWAHNLTVAEKDVNTQYRLETGENRVCVGNEKPNLTPKLKEYPDAGLALQRHYNG